MMVMKMFGALATKPEKLIINSEQVLDYIFVHNILSDDHKRAAQDNCLEHTTASAIITTTSAI